jgi:hypothetical protein
LAFPQQAEDREAGVPEEDQRKDAKHDQVLTRQELLEFHEFLTP